MGKCNRYELPFGRFVPALGNSIFKIFLLFAVFLIFQTKSYGDDSIRINAGWKKGEIKKYRIVQTGDRIIPFERNPSDLSYVVTIKILDSNSKGYLASWTTSEAKPKLHDKSIPDSVMPFMLHIPNGLNIIFSISLEGEFLKIENFEEIQKFLNAQVEKYITYDLLEGQDYHMINDMKSSIKNEFENAENFYNKYLGCFSSYYMLYGKSLSASQPTKIKKRVRDSKLNTAIYNGNLTTIINGISKRNLKLSLYESDTINLGDMWQKKDTTSPFKIIDSSLNQSIRNSFANSYSITKSTSKYSFKRKEYWVDEIWIRNEVIMHSFGKRPFGIGGNTKIKLIKH